MVHRLSRLSPLADLSCRYGHRGGIEIPSGVGPHHLRCIRCTVFDVDVVDNGQFEGSVRTAFMLILLCAGQRALAYISYRSRGFCIGGKLVQSW